MKKRKTQLYTIYNKSFFEGYKCKHKLNKTEKATLTPKDLRRKNAARNKDNHFTISRFTGERITLKNMQTLNTNFQNALFKNLKLKGEL